MNLLYKFIFSIKHHPRCRSLDERRDSIVLPFCGMDPFRLELHLRAARRFVQIDAAGLALVRTSDVEHLLCLFDKSSYHPSDGTPTQIASGRKSVYRELRDNDLVDHAFWMARRFFPHDLESIRLYVMLSIKIYFCCIKPKVQPKVLHPLMSTGGVAAAAAAAAAATPSVSVSSTSEPEVRDFSDDDDDDVDGGGGGGGPPNAAAAAVTSDTGRFSLAPDSSWLQIHKTRNGRQHKTERGVPSLTMRQLGFYDLDTLPIDWPDDVDPNHIFDNDAMALLVLSTTAHGTLRFRAGQDICPPTGSKPDAVRFVYERAAWPVFVGGTGLERRLYMPTDAIVTKAETVRQMRHTDQGLNSKEVAAYWPTDVRGVEDFNRAVRPDGSRLWLTSAQTLCRNQLLSKKIPKLPKGVSGAAALASDSSDILYRRFPSWYMPKLDRIDVFKFYIVTSSPELMRALSVARMNDNSATIQREFLLDTEPTKDAPFHF